MSVTLTRIALLLAVIVAATPACAEPPAPSSAAASAATPLVAIPSHHDTDIKFYAPGSAVSTGLPALAQMSHADLVLWLAGNQFFAMDDVIAAFQKQSPTTTVALLTLPPGLLLQAIKASGVTYDGDSVRIRPDIYASVNLGHLHELKRAGLMSQSLIYMHNELQIIVARGNPKTIAGIGDLTRPGVRISLPNPVNEGIMQFYLRKVLERHGLWQAISGDKDCIACEPVPNTWFTAVHHRETPQRIVAGQSDAGVVWRTEVLQALRSGAAVEAVDLPAEDSLRDEVSYAIGRLDDTPHAAAATAWLAFIGSRAAQDIYRSYGFVGASDTELTPKPLD
ncbi:substrate-binding domain-containing protein [Bradyrhizobium sp. U87765 SZCCT0131]|uniref:molybdate ABC transporter substrate-binding protein n=1 Tax=unclassified Bradyrhizobium TaxID=2631580 RepID=UPI001BA680E5|nr:MULTISPECIES: substrate-binding domain-containing protein [unclassified Bradyrhizobium]MBR1222242.1 substrate-binding domain-containing protein [Bradyrhizobium sp. U87765 SZCCT0131]MBR1264274.1 substrate-binding domain-containing protein [Bradyrhizobium sp. U87765 SZCCT0134]MBR1307943.1 substrate-binding domain-containing protein [Bradyrhizobium sp. U87765 SZCCT0110]MBR1320524.1 substrate-binding domain-containing protein [Bradyrhizobium sp. U87765 SZCCT0109]MBR1348363.1 substrate-binding d